MRASRTSGRFREPSGCTLNEVWCPSTSVKSLHSTRERKRTQTLVHSLTLFFRLERVAAALVYEADSFVLVSKTQPYVVTEFFLPKMSYFSDLLLLCKRQESIARDRSARETKRATKMSVQGCIYVTDC